MSEKSEKDILALVNATGETREKVVRALYMSNGAVRVAHQILVQSGSPPHLPPQPLTRDTLGAGASSAIRQETNGDINGDGRSRARLEEPVALTEEAAHEVGGNGCRPGTSGGIQGTSSGLQGTTSGVQGPSSVVQGTGSGVQGTSSGVQGTSSGVHGSSNGHPGPIISSGPGPSISCGPGSSISFGPGPSRTNTGKVAHERWEVNRDLKRKRRFYYNLPHPTYLTLKVFRPLQETSHNEIHFRVKQSTQLGKLKRSYSDRIGVPLYLLRFLYDGRRITDEHTPESLEMETDDIVEVYDELGSQNPGQTAPVAGQHTAEQLLPGTSRGGEGTRRDRQEQEILNRIEQDWTESGEDEMQTDSVKEEKEEEYREVDDEEEEDDDDDEEEEEEEDEMGSANSAKKRRVEPRSLSSPSPKINVEPPKADGDELRDLQRIKLKYDNLVKKLRDKVECPVCLDVPKRAPIPVCSNGHVVCQNCLRNECPTCRVRMDGSTSTLAVTIIENIEHICEWEECTETFTLESLPFHIRKCSYRMVECPGQECQEKHSLSRLLEHSLYCCIENNEITHYSLPHKFTYITKKDIRSIQNSHRVDLNWKLEGIKYDDKIFFVKVCCERRLGGRARWYFMVQMLGGAESCNKYTLNLVVFKGGGSLLEGAYSNSYCGDVCPIDISSNHEAYEKALCLTMIDSSMEKMLTKNLDTGNYEFSVMVNIYKSKP